MSTEDLITIHTSEEDLLRELPEGYCYGGNISAKDLSNRELCAEFCLIVKKSDGVFGPVDVEVIYRLQVPPEEAPASREKPQMLYTCDAISWTDQGRAEEHGRHEEFVARLACILQESGSGAQLLECVANLVAERDARLIYMSQQDELR